MLEKSPQHFFCLFFICLKHHRNLIKILPWEAALWSSKRVFGNGALAPPLNDYTQANKNVE